MSELLASIGTVFVSHASDDASVAMSIVSQLEGEGAQCWIAPRDVPNGSDYGSAIVGTVRSATAVIFLMSRSSYGSPHCLRELELAVASGVPLLPVNLDGTPPPPGFEYRLSTVQWIRLPTDSRASALLDRLGELGALGVPNRQPDLMSSGDSPWRVDRNSAVNYTIAGRHLERRAIADALDQLGKTGQGGIVLLGGPSGVGKTALAEEMVKQATARGCRVARTTCGQFNESMPFFPLRELMRQLSDSNDVLAHVERSFGRTSSQASMASVVESPVLDPQSRREAIVGTFANVVFGTVRLEPAVPVVLLIDDLESIDPGSVDGLLCLLTRITEGPVLVAGAFRSDVVEAPGRTHALRPLLDAARRLPERGTTLRLGPLRRDELPEVIQAILGGPLQSDNRLVERLWTETEGNALFLREILLAVRAFDDSAEQFEEASRLVLVNGEWCLRGSIDQMTTPQSVEDAISRNLDGLEPSERTYLELASVIGKRFGFDVALELSGADEDSFLEILERAVSVSIIRELEEPADSFEFSHGKVRDVLYHSLSRLRRKRIHAKVADLLKEASWAGESSRDALIGEHLYLAERYAEAAAYLERSAEHHLAVRNGNGAVETFERVLTCLERSASGEGSLKVPDIENRLIASLIAANEYDQAFERAISVLQKNPGSLAAGWAADFTGDVLQLTGDPMRAIEYYAMAEQAATTHASDELLLEVAADLGELHQRLAERLAGVDPVAHDAHRQEAERYLDRQYGLSATSTDAAARSRAFRNRAKQLRRKGLIEEATDLYEQSIAETDSRVATHQVLISYAKTLRLADRVDEATVVVERVLEWSTQIGARRSRGIALHYRGMMKVAVEGPTEAALTDINAAIALHTEIQYDRGLWEAHTLRGEWNALSERWQAALDDFRIALDGALLDDSQVVSAVVEQLRGIDELERADRLATVWRGRKGGGDDEQ